jgi:signal transduction histidine kinase
MFLDLSFSKSLKSLIAITVALTAISFFVLRINYFATVASGNNTIEGVVDLKAKEIKWDVFYGHSPLCGNIECHLSKDYPASKFSKKMILPALEFPLKGYEKGQIVYLRTKFKIPSKILDSGETLAFYTLYIWAKKFAFYVGGIQIESGGQESIFTTIPRNLVNTDGSVDIAIRVDPGDLPYQGLSHRANILIGLKKQLNSFQFLAHDYTTGFQLIYIVPLLIITLLFSVLFLTIYNYKDTFYFILFGFLSTISLILGSSYKSDYWTSSYDMGMVGQHGVKIAANLVFLKFIQTFFRRESKIFDNAYIGLVLTSSIYIYLYLFVPDFLKFMGGEDYDVMLTHYMKLAILGYGTILAIQTSVKLSRTHRKSYRHITTTLISGAFIVFVTIMSIDLFTDLIPNNAVWIDRTVNFLFFVIIASLVAIELVGNLKSAQKEIKDNEVQIAVAQTTQMLAHDVRRPFSLLKIGLSSLSEIDVSDAMKIKIAELVSEVNHSTRLVDGMTADIMEISSKVEPKKEPITVADLLKTTLDAIIQINRRENIKINYNFEHNFQLYISPLKIERAITNIVDNALQAMKGDGEIWFSTSETSDEVNRFLTLEIGNTGSYIDLNSRSILFDSFYTKGKDNGTGLGLAICKKVVEAHNGTVNCDSDKLKGTWFTLTLPQCNEVDQVSSDSLPTRILKTVSSAVEPVERNLLIKADVPTDIIVAVVEDNAFIREAWVSTLKDVNVYSFVDPKSFWAYFNEKKSSVIELTAVITDYHFDTQLETNGEVFSNEIKLIAPELPVLLSSETIESLQEGGGFQRIDKLPIKWSELEKIINNIGEAV